MVSTRGVRYKFSEGERVLCYEPDPTKAKVLYDSKVLEVIENRDRRGRRVEYLIHFQGWNSSWDRCVSEDFVLKDTEENRQLQRDLAEKSQLQLGAYLYRRERKKGTTASAGVPAKRARHGFSDDGSSSSTQPDEVETAGDTDSSIGSGSSSQPPSSPPHSLGRAQINLPPQLRDSLTFDYHLIVKRGRLSRLPASPCAAEVLEMFVRWFARSGAWRPPKHNKDQHKPNMLDVCCRLNLVREVADGIRVYFDFILKGHLLYKQELNQYHEYCGQYEQDVTTSEIKREPMDVYEDESSEPGAEPPLTSPNKTPEYSHLPPDPDDGRLDNQLNSNGDYQEKAEVNGKCSSEKSDDTVREVGCCTRSGTLARRLRSHKSVVSEPEETPEIPPAPPSSAGSSESWSSAPPAAPPAPHRTPLSLMLDKVAKWQIIPHEGTEHLPCRVYGAIHLARLFVKLPAFLNATQMPDLKLKLILKYIDMFIQYLEEHTEWFGESYYLPSTRSH